MSTESKVSNVFPSRFHRLFSILLQLGLPSSAHDLLLVTLLIDMPISILFSLSVCACALSAPGNCLKWPKAIQQLRVSQVVCGPLSQSALHTTALLSPLDCGPLSQSAQLIALSPPPVHEP